MNLSFVIPCYNEESNVGLIFSELHRVFDKEGISIECVMVNDGSKDNTRASLRKLYDENPKTNLKIISFSRNFGKEAAILCGLSHTTGDNVCIIDADLQQTPEVALQMYKKLLSDPDLDCVAAYQKDRKEGKLLTFFKKCFYMLINGMCDIDFVSGASDFRVFRRKNADAILSLKEYYRFSKGIFSWIGFNTYYMEYEVQERHSGTSKWNFFKLCKYAFDGIVAYTTLPLKIPAFLGAFTMLAAFIYLIVIIVNSVITDISLTGNQINVLIVLILSGIQFLILGVFGEYLAKTYIQGKERPIYIEKELLEREEDAAKG